MVTSKYIHLSSSANISEEISENIIKELGELSFDIVTSFYLSEKGLFPEYSINKCDIFIAIVKYHGHKTSYEQTFYEIGFAAALGKKIIIVSDNEDEVPNFLKNYNFIKYEKFSFDIAYHKFFGENHANENARGLNVYKHWKFENLILNYKNNPSIIDKITENDFLRMMYNYFKDHTEFSPQKIESRTNDWGYDLVLESYNDKKKTLVEVKKYNSNSKVSINVVQQLLGAISLYDADHAILITTSTFTNSTKDFAAKYRIELWDFETLYNLAKDIPL